MQQPSISSSPDIHIPRTLLLWQFHIKDCHSAILGVYFEKLICSQCSPKEHNICIHCHPAHLHTTACLHRDLVQSMTMNCRQDWTWPLGEHGREYHRSNHLLQQQKHHIIFPFKSVADTSCDDGSQTHYWWWMVRLWQRIIQKILKQYVYSCEIQYQCSYFIVQDERSCLNKQSLLLWERSCIESKAYTCNTR